MINLESTDKISLISSGTADLDVFASYVDRISSTEVQTPGRKPTAIVTAATTDIVLAPAAGTVRNIKSIVIKNKHASGSQTVTPQINVSGTLYELCSDCILLAGESLVLNDAGVWFHYDANGGVYGQSLPTASDTVVGGIRIATQAEQEGATSTVIAVSPGRQHYHPGSTKFWVKFAGNSTTINASYNMTSITDGTTQATVTIATDFSSADWCVQATAVAAAATAAGARLASCLTMAAGSIIVFCVDGNATTALADPTSWCVAGMGDHA